MKKSAAVTALKIILGIYILLCIIIAGLNYGIGPTADSKTARIISNLWHFYENEFKTIMIVVCSFLSIKALGKNESTGMRKQNLTGLIISALVIHITGPIITGTRELYFFSMPIPWSSYGIQVFNEAAPFHSNFVSHWGAGGLSSVLIFIILYNIVIFTGTLLFGRRLQCSQVCMFNGFASEIFSSAFPLFGKKNKKAGKMLKKIFTSVRVLLLAVSIVFTAAAALSAAGYQVRGAGIFYTFETVKYLSVELLMAMFFWIVFTGRGYCHYCPAGTVLAFISRIGGQRIRTDLEKCISCGKCSRACPMSIDVKAYAAEKKDLVHFDCVGCGHCVDSCPTGTLAYSTRFLTAVRILTNGKRRVFEG